MIRVGIITMFHDSTNYGGVLQAYALTTFLNKHFNVDAKQIPYIMNSGFSDQYSDRKITFKKVIRVINKKMQKIHSLKYYKIVKRIAIERKRAFSLFCQDVPQLEKVYTYESLKNTNVLFDVFITGSDQVWNCINRGYLLDFVENNKQKISYAASISRKELSEKEKRKFESSLKSFSDVSVREESDVQLINSLLNRKAKHVLDPTLLLSEHEWNSVCEGRIIEDEYVFCYFLGTNKKARKVAKLFAEKNRLKIVYVPMSIGDMKNKKNECVHASPKQFLSLIKNARYIFTDSFHAVVFSYIFKKNYFVFNRNKDSEMNSRIINITKLFGTKERYCSSKKKENLNYILTLKDIEYGFNDKVEKKKLESIEYLKQNFGEKHE